MQRRDDRRKRERNCCRLPSEFIGFFFPFLSADEEKIYEYIPGYDLGHPFMKIESVEFDQIDLAGKC